VVDNFWFIRRRHASPRIGERGFAVAVEIALVDRGAPRFLKRFPNAG